MDLETYVRDNIGKIQLKKCSGPLEHWITALQKKAWGLDERYSNQWNQLRKGDVVLFHAIPGRIDNKVSGIIGAGVVAESGERRKDGRWWYAEFTDPSLEGRWPLVVDFSDILFAGDLGAIDHTSAAEEKSAETLAIEVEALSSNRASVGLYHQAAGKRFPAQASTASVDPQGALALIESLSPYLRSVEPSHQPSDTVVQLRNEIEALREEVAELRSELFVIQEVDHETLVEGLTELGKRKGYEVSPTQPCDSFYIDVTWKKRWADNPNYAFEVNVKGSPHKDLLALKHAYDKWNVRPFLISTDADKCRDLVGGAFHEIEDVLHIYDTVQFQRYMHFQKEFDDIDRVFNS